MGNIWRRIINFLPKLTKSTFLSTKKMDYEPKRKLIRIDEQYYKFFEFNNSQDSENSNEESINEEDFSVTEIQFCSHIEGKYKHSFYVPR